MSTVTCPTCGSENPTGARFCGECGTALPAAAAPTAAIATAGEPTAVVPPVPPPGGPLLPGPGSAPPPDRSSGSKAGAALLVLLAVLVVGGVVALLVRDDDEEDPVVAAPTTTTTVETTTTTAPETTTTGEEVATTTDPDEATATSSELGSGDVQVTLEWDSAADLDLAVTDPTGEQVSFTTPESPTGGRLDDDANESCERDGDPVENVFWPTDGAPVGTYTVDVTGHTTDSCEGGPEDGGYTLTIRVSGEKDRVITDDVEEGETKTTTFEVT